VAGPQVTVEGADRLRRTLGTAGRKITKLAAANADVALGIVGAARPPRRTGRLAGSLSASSSDDEAVVSSGLVYAPVIEYGWAGHGIEATRFLRNAEESRRAATLKRYDRHCDDTVKTVKGV
jgi:hypothetical protein